MTPFDTLWLDTETFNETPITYGTYRYAENARVDIVSYAIDDGPVQVLDMTLDDPHDVWLLQDLLANARRIIAHNAMFDRAVLRLGNLKIEVPTKKWRCSMVKALLHGLPGGLDKLCGILNVPQDLAKMKEGKALMMLFCKPQGKNRKIRIADRTTHPEERAKYLDYAKHDISAMREVWARLPSWNYGEEKGGALERDLWHLDQEINDRGVRIDLPLVHAAIRATDDEQARLKARTQELTGFDAETGEGLESATKRDKMLEFILEDYGVGLADLTKATVAKLLEEDDLPPGLTELLRLRQQASTSSTAKYNAFARGCNSDGYLRGMLQFSGASRTRRDAGRTVQLQNLPSRGLLKQKEIEFGIQAMMAQAEDLVFDDVMKLTASTIRSVIIAPEGQKLVVADLANIEGRDLAWLAGESWKLQAFRDYDTFLLDENGQKIFDGKDDFERMGPDLYKLAYAKAFGISPRDVDKVQRSIGKVMELACFSAETKVLTDSGVKDIVEVSTSDLLWDGVAWVAHKGLVERNVRRTVNVDGINLTPDHLILINGIWTPAKELVLSEKILSLALATGSANLPSPASTSVQGEDARMCGRAVRAVLRSVGYISTTFAEGLLRVVMPAQKKPLLSGEKNTTGTPTSSPIQATELGCLIGFRPVSTGATTKTTRGTQTTEVGEFSCLSRGEKTVGAFSLTLRRLMAGMLRTWNSIASTLIKATNRGTSDSLPDMKTASTKEPSGSYPNASESLRPVFDIMNSGPRNRFTVVSNSGYLIAHNCGYAGGIHAFVTFALGYQINLDDMADRAWDTLPADVVAEAEDFLDWMEKQKRTFPLSRKAATTCEVFKRLWRNAHPMTVKLWDEAKQGFVKATRNPGVTYSYRGLKFRRDGAWLRIQIPSGRCLCYPHPEVDDNGQCSYMGVNQFTRKWCRIKTHGGKLVENLTQSNSRDVLFDRMMAIEEAGYAIRMRVHDELITTAPDTDEYSSDELARLMSINPDWATGLPLAAAGFESYRYRK